MSISRRGFIKGTAIGTLAAGTTRASGTKHFAGYPGRNGLLHDTTLCVGCRACEESCNEVNELPKPKVPFDDKSVFEYKRRISDNEFTVVNRYKKKIDNTPAVYRKHQCMHCNEPCCDSVCFVNAFTKTPEGPVLYNPDVCVGCRYCMTACPYYALGYEYGEPLTPRVMRCTMCYYRIKKGENPGCSDACPTGAITFGKRKDLLKVARERIRKHPDQYIDYIYGENDFGGTSWMMLAGIPFGQLGLYNDASHTPLIENTKGFLSAVPIVLTVWPGFLLGIYAFRKRREKISEEEKEAALAAALAKADEETKNKLKEAAKMATKDKERAIEQAVKKALAEAQKENSK